MSTYQNREVRSCGKYSGPEICAICAPRPGMKAMGDLRKLGLPESVFAWLLEKRHAQILLAEARVAGGLITDTVRRAQAARTASIIAADKEAADRETERLEFYGRQLTY